jgi:hypothetical protein
LNDDTYDEHQHKKTNTVYRNNLPLLAFGHNLAFGLILVFCLITAIGLILASLAFWLVSFISLVGIISLAGFSLIGLIGLISPGNLGMSASPTRWLIGLISLVSIGFNGPIGIGIIIKSLEFEIKTKISQCDMFVREGWLWCVRRLSSLTGLNSVFFFGLALQNGKQIFFNRIPQMTKYFVMRECEDIFVQNPYAVTQHLLTRSNFLFFNSLKGFWGSLAEISLSLTLFSTLII